VAADSMTRKPLPPVLASRPRRCLGWCSPSRAEALAARNIRKEKNIGTLVAEILEATVAG
jgi:hypothetical protein